MINSQSSIRRFKTIGKFLLTQGIAATLATFCVAQNVNAQEFYGNAPYYVDPQLTVGNSMGNISGYPGDVSGVPFDASAQFPSGSFPSYPQTVEGYSPSMQFQEGAVYPSPQQFPQNFNASLGDNIVQGADGQYQILGDVASSIPIGDSRFDNIPVLEDPHIDEGPKLPELKVPLNENEFINRVDALKERFSKLPLSIQRSTPGRLLRYSLIGGPDQTFLAPQTSVQKTGKDETTSQSELKPMFAIGALCWNYPCSNRRIMREVNGKPVPSVGYGFQSQRGEFLATLAFARIDRNYEIHIDDKKFTVQDLVDWEKYSCSSYANLSLVAVGLAHYSQNPDETWINAAGETWSLARILDQESQRPIDWETAESTNKLLAFTYLLARLKTSAYANTPQLSEALKRTEGFLVAVKNRIWEIIGESALSNSLFFKSDLELTTPYMKVYVNGKLFRWITLVSSPEEMDGDKMRKAMFELCGLVDQLFNSVDNLDTLSATDEESLAVAMQTLVVYRKHLASSGSDSQ